MSEVEPSSQQPVEPSPARRALLAKWLHGALGQPAANPLLQRRSAEPAPLSFAQERLWFLQQLAPESPAYHITRSVRFEGFLDVEALRRSLEQIVVRHEALRTTFPVVAGSPAQVVAAPGRLALPTLDLSALTPSERVAEQRRLTDLQMRRPFDLTCDSPLRATLMRLDQHEHLLVLTIHHLVADGWSLDLLFRELGTLYSAFLQGLPSPLRELPIQYADYAAWQREWLQGAVLESQLAYWRQQLSDAPPLLDLPTDWSRPAIQQLEGSQHALLLPGPLTQALKAISRGEGATLFMTLLAAFQLLLSRYTGQQDLVVGSPVAGRNRSEVEPLIGLFVNTLVLRTDLAGNPTFRELLHRVRGVALAAYTHQDLPFERLVQELQPERDSGRHPLFDAVLNFHQALPTLELPGLTVRFEAPPENDAKLALTLYAAEQDGELQLRLMYQRALFSAERMHYLLEQLHYLLDQVAAEPGRPIDSYSLVSPSTRPCLPDPTSVIEEPRYEPVTSLIAGWAERTPAQPAVLQGDRAFSYGEIVARAELLARALRAQGLERGQAVAVLGPRSFGLISSMLATLLSGGVLVPIDPTLPTRRQAGMLQEAEATYLLYVGDWQAEDHWLQTAPAPKAILVDPQSGLPLDRSPLAPAEDIVLPELSPEDPAYIFFTSGSTGLPKGVLGSHKGLSHFLAWQRETFQVTPADRCAQLTSISFDMVLRDVFLPLVSGATLCLPAACEEVGSNQILAWLEQSSVSLLHVVPSLARWWLADVPEGVSLKALRWLFFAGEPLADTLVRRWRQAFPEAGEIVNLYGPTETTMVKCFHLVPPDPPIGVQPAGRPLPQTQALVLAQNHRPCGIGEPGEIVLRTPFRTLGYVNAPDEQCLRFQKNPFRDDARDLLYFTGDRGRYRPDGLLEILGRLDDQLKIRGVRIEPAELEALLGTHPAVQEAAVVAHEDPTGNLRLVAYLVARGETPPAGDLRSFLRQWVPEAMVPSVWVPLDRLPLTNTGKVDRSALPPPEWASSKPSANYAAPRTPVEERLAAIWTELLGLDQVSIHDDFFDLGGHSLLLTRLVARINDALGVDLRLRDLFQASSLAEQAELVARQQLEQVDDDDLARWLDQAEALSTDDLTHARSE